MQQTNLPTGPGKSSSKQRIAAGLVTGIKPGMIFLPSLMGADLLFLVDETTRWGFFSPALVSWDGTFSVVLALLATILYLFYVAVVTTLFRLKRLGVLLVLLGGTICSALSIALVACDYPDLVLAGPALIAVGAFFTACASVAFWAFFVLIGWMDDPGIEWLPARW